MEARHTATPWRTKTGPGWYDTYIVGELVGAHEPTIATVPSVHVDHERYLANAAFIVRACNAHDELVLVLKAIVAADDAAIEALRDMGAPLPADAMTLTEAARAALAKATGAA